MRYVSVSGLRVHQSLHAFICDELLQGLSITADTFFDNLAIVCGSSAPKIAAELVFRDTVQGHLNAWHAENPYADDDDYRHRYTEFLEAIGYLEPDPAPFEVVTRNVDDELSTTAGPQLVVPSDNARFVLNAANARWGSLYDALYGTDALLPVDPDAADHDPERAAEVVAYVADFLDEHFPLDRRVSHADAHGYTIVDNGLQLVFGGRRKTATLKDASSFVGYQGSKDAPTSILLRHHGLLVELRFDRATLLGSIHTAGLTDVHVEAAVSSIVDFEDSVAAVDAQDKVNLYRNWLGLMRGDLQAEFERNGETIKRELNHDRVFTRLDGGLISVRMRSLLLARNVGHHMYTDAVLDSKGKEIPEGVLDAMVTAAAALHDLNKARDRNPLDERTNIRNSRYGSIYIVKPKMHSAREVRITCELFARVERALELPVDTIKIGIMDEERRLSLNLRGCLEAAQSRVVFINTGFLDRTGDEIHTSMRVGPMVRKGDMAQQPWLQSYELQNVDVGIETGLVECGQIGKGMWARPDDMKAMLDTKADHPKSGASTAWVPSPSAATLHALHYHSVDVSAAQSKASQRDPVSRAELLRIPVAIGRNWSSAEVRAELATNLQSILGYTVRWIDQGIGCSKVPNTDNVALMEDRATLRISSQHVANWLTHGVCDQDTVREVMSEMAAVVDQQNAGDPNYRPMVGREAESFAFAAAYELVLNGAGTANGYTDFVLHRRRREAKAAHGN